MRFIRCFFALAAGALISLNIIALLPPSSLGLPDPALVFAVRKEDSTIGPAEAWRQIKAARKQYHRGDLDEGQYFAAVTTAVNQRMTNPLQRDVDELFAMRPAITSSWLIWALNRDGRFNNYEYQLPWRSLRRGLGTCGAQSITLASILSQDGFKADLWGSHRHVVTRVRTDAGRSYALDADYGVVIQDARPGLIPEIYRRAYSQMLQKESEGAIPIILEHYAEQDSVQYDALDGLTERRYSADRYFGIEPIVFARLIIFLEWAIPAIFLLAALANWRIVRFSSVAQAAKQARTMLSSKNQGV